MAVTNGVVRLLAGARDNDTVAPYSLVPASPSGSYSLNDYEVPSVTFTSSMSFTISLLDLTTLTTVLNAGGSRRNELRSSTRTNATWTSDPQMDLYPDILNQTQLGEAIDTGSSVGVTLTWNDGFNPSRVTTLYFTITP